MLKMYLRFVFSFSLLHSNIFTLSRTTLENSLSLKRTQCRTNWHYFSNDESCLLFATSQQGDLTWNDSVKACEINSAETFTLSNSKDLELIEKKIEEKPIYVAQFQKGAWIGKANWSKDDLCDRFDDMQSICMIVVRGLYDQRLCLRSVSCEEFHPFICRTRAMTEEEFDESSMTRVSWWECIIPIWCVVDYGLEAAAQKKQEEQAKAAQVAEIKAYISQFDFNIPSDTELIANSQNKPSAQSVHAFNETCIQNKTECTEPLQCIGGFCHCSHTGESTTTSPLSFWTGSDCAPCPAGYVALDENCYKLSVQKDDEMNWIRARSRCQESGGDLLVIRSAKDFGLFKFWVGRKIQQEQMHQRTPRNATYFASVWLGAKLVDWTGDGTYQLVTPGPVLNKNSFYWCGHSSPLDQEPNYTGLKKTGERQECVGLAVFPDGTVCMHDWFCSWDSYVLCEIYRPSQQNTSIEAQEEGEQSNDLITYGVIGGGILVLILISVGIYCTCCKKKNIDSSDSTESAVSTASEL